MLIVEFAASWHFFDGVAKTLFHVLQRNTLLLFSQQQCPFYKLWVWWQEILPLDIFSARLSKLPPTRPEEQFAEQQFFPGKKSILERLRTLMGKFLCSFQILLVGLSHFHYPEKPFEIGKFLHPLWIFSAGCHIYTLSVQMRLLGKIAFKKTYTVFIFPGDGWKIFRPFVWWYHGGIFKTVIYVFRKKFGEEDAFFQKKESIAIHDLRSMKEKFSASFQKFLARVVTNEFFVSIGAIWWNRFFEKIFHFKSFADVWAMFSAFCQKIFREFPRMHCLCPAIPFEENNYLKINFLPIFLDNSGHIDSLILGHWSEIFRHSVWKNPVRYQLCTLRVEVTFMRKSFVYEKNSIFSNFSVIREKNCGLTSEVITAVLPKLHPMCQAEH